MSQRHRSQEAVPPPKMDVRAHAHNERHRIHSELDPQLWSTRQPWFAERLAALQAKIRTKP